MPYGQLAWLKQASPQTAKKFYDTPNSFVVGSTPVPGLGATVLPLFASLHDYHYAGNTMTGSQFPWVCYDPENWARTMQIEKQHIKGMLWAFADLAHARGQKLVAAPSRDIIYAKPCDDPWQWPETIDAGYLRIGIPLAANDADVFICQAQGSEKDPVEYASLVFQADKQTLASQTFWTELTTNFATAAQMKAAYDAAMASGARISGYWVVIADQTQVQIAVDFFNML
jgi:hypothetical protein